MDTNIFGLKIFVLAELIHGASIHFGRGSKTAQFYEVLTL